MKRYRISIKWGLLLGLCGLVLVVLVGGALARTSDARHQRFQQTGASILSWLKELSAGVELAHERGGVAPLRDFFDSRWASPGRGTWDFVVEHRTGGVEIAEWRRIAEAPAVDLDQRLEELGSYLREIRTIERIEHKIDLIERMDGVRVELVVKIVLAGIDFDDNRFEDRLFSKWTIVEAGEGGWRVIADVPQAGARTRGRATDFDRLDPAERGIDFVHSRDPRLDMDSRHQDLAFDVVGFASGGVSAADVDRDGRPDLFFSDGIRSRLFLNRTIAGEPWAFEDATEEVGLDGLGAATVVLFADLDNDGDSDLFLGRYLAPSLLFLNDGGDRFVLGQELDPQPVMSAVFFDADNDGWLDLFIANYGDAFEAFPRIPFFARNGITNMLYRNHGGRELVPDEAWIASAETAPSTGWTLAVTAGDIDDDGDQDIVTADDFGRKNFYRNDSGRWTEVAAASGMLDFSGGMGLLLADLDRDGDQDLYTSNIKSNQRWFGEDVTIGSYIRNVARTRWLWTDFKEYLALRDVLGGDWRGLGKEIGEGNSVFRNDGRGVFTEDDDAGANQAGWSWGVVAFDYDNDADLDLYAANGWISNPLTGDL